MAVFSTSVAMVLDFLGDLVVNLPTKFGVVWCDATESSLGIFAITHRTLAE